MIKLSKLHSAILGVSVALTFPTGAYAFDFINIWEIEGLGVEKPESEKIVKQPKIKPLKKPNIAPKISTPPINIADKSGNNSIFLNLEDTSTEIVRFPMSHLGRVVGELSASVKTMDSGELRILSVDTYELSHYLPKLKKAYIPTENWVKNGVGNFFFDFNHNYEIVVTIPNEYFKSPKVREVVKQYQRPRLTHDIKSNISRVVATHSQKNDGSGSNTDLTVSSKTRWNRAVLWSYLSSNENILNKGNLKYEGAQLDYYVGNLNSGMYANLPNLSHTGFSFTNKNSISFNRYQAFNKSVYLDSDSTVRVYIDDKLESSTFYKKGTHIFNLPYSSSLKKVRLEIENEYAQVIKIDFEAPGYNTADNLLYEFGVGAMETDDSLMAYGSISNGGFEFGGVFGEQFYNLGSEYQYAFDNTLFTEIYGGLSKNADMTGYQIGGSVNKNLDGTFIGFNALNQRDFSQLGGSESSLSRATFNISKNILPDLNLSGSFSLTDKLSRQSLRARYSLGNLSSLGVSFDNTEGDKRWNMSFLYRFDDIQTNTQYSSAGDLSNTTSYKINEDNRVTVSANQNGYLSSNFEHKNDYSNLYLSHTEDTTLVRATTTLLTTPEVFIPTSEYVGSSIILKGKNIAGAVNSGNCKVASGESCLVKVKSETLNKLPIDKTDINYDAELVGIDEHYLVPNDSVKVVELNTVNKQLFTAVLEKDGVPIKSAIGTIFNEKFRDEFFTDENGEMVIELIPGKYVIKLRDLEKEIIVTGSDGYIASAVNIPMEEAEYILTSN